tara:strand:- start:12 stop:308 length:297 start_codon:yes stop_codon:yes gene_type:complete
VVVEEELIIPRTLEGLVVPVEVVVIVAVVVLGQEILDTLEQQIKHLHQTDGVMMAVTLLMELLVQVVVEQLLEAVNRLDQIMVVPVVLEQHIQLVDLL